MGLLRVETVAGRKARGYANRGRRSEGEETPWQRAVSSNRVGNSSKVVSSNRADNSRARCSSWDAR